MISKKDFKQLANMCARVKNKSDRDFCICWTINFCKNSNPCFDEDRFREWVRRVIAGESLIGLG